MTDADYRNEDEQNKVEFELFKSQKEEEIEALKRLPCENTLAAKSYRARILFEKRNAIDEQFRLYKKKLFNLSKKALSVWVPQPLPECSQKITFFEFLRFPTRSDIEAMLHFPGFSFCNLSLEELVSLLKHGYRIEIKSHKEGNNPKDTYVICANCSEFDWTVIRVFSLLIEEAKRKHQPIMFLEEDLN